MSLLKDRKTSKKKEKEAAEEKWDEIEESEEEKEAGTQHGEDSSISYTKRDDGSEDGYDEDDDPEDDEEDDEFEDDEDEDEKPHRRKKNKRFPVGGLIFMFVLIGIALGAGYFGMTYYEKFHALNEQYNAARDTASAELAAAQDEFALADPDSPANVAVRDELKDVLLADMREQVKQMESEEAELDSSIREAEEKMKELEGVEDFDYYKAIYDEYVEGREYVEELLSGN
ncbi:MAG: hypothetical protein IJI06_02695 [Oscillospiraceae bacterium]|nr:hypothetical protein [Oscillospiraceae bacterium]